MGKVEENLTFFPMAKSKNNPFLFYAMGATYDQSSPFHTYHLSLGSAL